MLLWSGQVVSTLGSSASQVVYPLLILALTASPAAAGIAGSARALPYILFSEQLARPSQQCLVFALWSLGLALIATLNRHVHRARPFKDLASVTDPRS